MTHKAVNNTSPEYTGNLISVSNDTSNAVGTRASFDPCLVRVPLLVKLVLIHV